MSTLAPHLVMSPTAKPEKLEAAAAESYHDAFNSPTADLIICSSDSVRFRAHRLILSEASSVFDGMFTLPVSSPPPLISSPTDEKPELPVVTLSEDAETLEGLLRVCYPAKAKKLDDLGVLRKVMVAAEKYMVQGAVELLGATLTDHKLLTTEPMRAYALACRFRLREVVVAAAKASLRHPCPAPAFPELEEASAQAYHDLLSYRQQCLDVFGRLSLRPWAIWADHSLEISRFPGNTSNWSPSCARCVYTWWDKSYRPQFKEILHRDVSGHALLAPQSLRRLTEFVSSSCQECYTKRMVGALECQARMAMLLDREIAQVSVICAHCIFWLMEPHRSPSSHRGRQP